MQKPTLFESDRDLMFLLLFTLSVGVVIGILLTPKSERTHAPQHDTHNTKDRSRKVAKNRSGVNLVFGNVIIGSNNAPGSKMPFGYDDSGDNG